MPNPSGRRLSSGQTNTIAVVIPYFTLASQTERLRGVMSAIVSTDYDISLFAVENSTHRNKIFRTVPRRGRVDGMLVFSLYLTDQEVRRIKQENVPTVLVESTHPQLPHLYLDDKTASANAVEYLIQLGHRKIAYIGDSIEDRLGSNFSRNRYEGYCRALQAHHIPLNPDYILTREGRPTREKGRNIAYEMLQMGNRPTAVFAFSDDLALGVIEAARALQIQIPKELSVIGYDDIEFASLVQLTTVSQNLFDSGVQGVNLLLNVIAGKQVDSVAVQVPTTLIRRETTAPLTF